jgi:hypothetical protein
MAVQLVWLALLALVLEFGWIGLWPLSASLSHSAPFTAAFLASHPFAAQLFQVTLHLAQRSLPALSAEPMTEPLGAPVYVNPAWALAAIFLWLAAAYLAALAVLSRGVRHTRVTLVIVLAATLAFQATLLFLPGLFSQDVFSYIAYGRLSVTYELNPYVWPPSAIPKDEVLLWVAGVWRTYAAPYGPAWLDVQWVMARFFGERAVADQAMAYRTLANALLLANLGLLWALLGRLTALDRGQRVTALAALAWNPLVLFEVAGNAHNDVLMVSFSLLALLVFGRSGGSAWSAACFAVGALVKYLSGVGIVWVGVSACARVTSMSGRAVRLGLVVAVAALVVVVMAWPWLELPDSIEPLLAETATVGYVNSLPDSLGLALADAALGPLAGLSQEVAREVTRGLARVVLLSAFGLYLVWETRRVWTCPHAASVARATARACLIYVLLVSTSVQTWYFCLPVALALGLGWRAALARVNVGYSLLALPALYLSYYLREATPVAVFLVYGFAPLLPLWQARLRRARARAHEPAAEAVGDDEQRAERHRVTGAVMEQAGG